MLHLVFDTETTELIHNSLQPLQKQPRIVEFFGLLLDDQQDWQEAGQLALLFNPGIAIPKKSTEITGITDAMVKSEPKFAFHLKAVRDFISRADVAVAHNLSYDTAVVDFEFQREGTTLVWPKRKVCTVEATESMKGFRLSLSALHQELFGEPFKDAHRAEPDVRALARCYIELVNRGEI